MATKKTYEEIPPIVKNYDTYLCRLLFIICLFIFILHTANNNGKKRTLEIY